MVAFEGQFDLNQFQSCLRYIQDSLDWLIAAEENRLSTISMFSPALLEQTLLTFTSVSPHRLNALQNVRALINRLPSEIFSHILLRLDDQTMPPRTSILPQTERYHHPTCLWVRANLVCRRWRREVLNTPKLWTTIKVGYHEDASYQRATTWLARSGALPLTVVFTASILHVGRTRQDIRCIFGESHRINGLYFYNSIRLSLALSLIMQAADQLETLRLPGGLGSIHFDQPMLRELPKLEILWAESMTFWRIWPLHGLRHLSLRWTGHWSLEHARDFFGMLAANACLEELFIDGKDGLDQSWEHHSLITMPKLKQLFVKERMTRSSHSMLQTLDRTLSLSPICTRFYVIYISGNFLPEDALAFCPVERLIIGSGGLLGTDGVSTCVINGTFNRSLLFLGCSQVREVWFHGSLGPSFLPFESDSLTTMYNVVKLVFLRNIPVPPNKLEGCPLRRLQELRLLRQRHRDHETILQFLRLRSQNGSKVDTLRFVVDPTSEACAGFNSWKERKEHTAEFERWTNQVIFEEVDMVPKCWLKDFVSAELGLPEACKYTSPTSQLWRPWYEFTSHSLSSLS